MCTMVASGVCSSAVVPRSFLFPGPMSAPVAGKVGHSNAQVTGFTSYRTGMIPGMGWNHDLVSCSWLAFPCGFSFDLKKHMASYRTFFFFFGGPKRIDNNIQIIQNPIKFRCFCHPEMFLFLEQYHRWFILPIIPGCPTFSILGLDTGNICRKPPLWSVKTRL